MQSQAVTPCGVCCMSNKIRSSSAISIILLAGCDCFAQTQAQLRSSDTELTLEALPERPRVVQFDFPGQPVWQNRGSEMLIMFADMAGEKAALTWTFDSAASRINDQQVVFVYNSAFPHLRVSWEWRTREEYGPVEHQIRIENLDSREIWIPMQDSLAFVWQVDSKQSLQQLFVEKGADKPSNVGTDRESIGVGFTGRAPQAPTEISSKTSRVKSFHGLSLRETMPRIAAGMPVLNLADELASRSRGERI